MSVGRMVYKVCLVASVYVISNASFQLLTVPRLPVHLPHNFYQTGRAVRDFHIVSVKAAYLVVNTTAHTG